jgi:hypothetical protein
MYSSTSFLGQCKFYSREELPEWQAFKYEWQRLPLGQSPTGRGGWNQTFVNPIKSYTDFYLFHALQLLKKYNVQGVYLDGYAGMSATSNLEAGFGYVDEAGNVHPTYPVMAGREMMKRLYTMIHQQKPKNGFLMVHCSTSLIMPILAFSDGTYTGENFCWADLKEKIKKAKGYYSAALTPDWLRGVYNMRPFGPIPSFDSRLSINQLCDPATAEAGHSRARNLFGLLLTHDIHSWSGWTEGYEPLIMQTMDWWGTSDPEVKFLPYWDKPNWLKVTGSPDAKVNFNDKKQDKKIYASAYINYSEKKMLIAAVNFSGYTLGDSMFKKKGREGYYIYLNLKKLGLEGKNLKVYDAESHNHLSLPYENGCISLPFFDRRQQLKLINVTWN